MLNTNMRYITKKRIEMECSICGTTFRLWKNDLKPNNFCSRKCSASRMDFKETVRKTGLNNKGRVLDKSEFKNRNLCRGEKHWNWKGGVMYMNKKGYYRRFSIKYVKCPNEFISMSRKDGYVMEHRLIMAKSIGRPLKRSEVVHHIDHNPENNDLLNLRLFATNGEHKKYESQNCNK